MAKEKTKSYTEAELVKIFHLKNISSDNCLLMQEWISVEMPTFTPVEVYIFEDAFSKAVKNVRGWSEEDLKMKFISKILPLGHLEDNEPIFTYFEKTIFDTIEGHFLSTKSDFMVAKGILDMPEMPYFHFQEYKPHKKPTGDSMAQLLEAMLIAQYKNANENPIYGCEVIGRHWSFVILKDKNYCISQTFDCTQRENLLKIVAILRKFRYILETKLL